jgi:hypothetical protein
MTANQHTFNNEVKYQVYALANGKCQNPDCKLKLDFIGGCAEFAHICARNKGGPRYNKKKNVNILSNCLLLCSNCHTIIDKNPNDFPRKLLHIWKNPGDNQSIKSYLDRHNSKQKDLLKEKLKDNLEDNLEDQLKDNLEDKEKLKCKNKGHLKDKEKLEGKNKGHLKDKDNKMKKNIGGIKINCGKTSNKKYFHTDNCSIHSEFYLRKNKPMANILVKNIVSIGASVNMI